MLNVVGITENERDQVHHPVGCGHCGKIGFRGRKAIFEMLKMNSEIRELAFNRAPIDKIRDAALRSGMRPLVADGKQPGYAEGMTYREVAELLVEHGVDQAVEFDGGGSAAMATAVTTSISRSRGSTNPTPNSRS